MDDRLNHEQKMFSKTNWKFTKKIVESIWICNFKNIHKGGALWF